MRRLMSLAPVATAAAAAAQRRQPQRAERRRFLPRQAGQPDRRRLDRRRLRHLWPHGRAPSRQAHPRQADRGGAEHAGGGRARRRQPHLQRRGQGRHRHHAVPEHRAARAVLREQAGAVRRRASSAGSARRPTEVALYMFWHTSKIRTLKDAQTQEYVAGAAGAASTPAFYGRVFNQIFNFKARFIVGYPGQNEILHAHGGRRGRGDGVAVLVEPQDLAAGLAQGRQDPLPVPVRRRGRIPSSRSVPLALDLLQTDADKTLLAVAAAPLGARAAVRRAARHSRRPARGVARRDDGDVQGPGLPRRLRQAAARMRRPHEAASELGALIGRAYAAPADVRKRLIGMYQVGAGKSARAISPRHGRGVCAAIHALKHCAKDVDRPRLRERRGMTTERWRSATRRCARCRRRRP